MTIARSFVSLCLAAVTLASLGVDADLRIDGGELGWDERPWYVQVDGVMGGKSSGGLEFLSDSTVMKFTGDIVLDGGGFSSVRRSVDLDLSSYAGVVVTLEAGVPSSSSSAFSSPTGIQLQFGQGNSWWDYSSAFTIPLSSDETVASVYLPIESFDRASRSGRNCWGDCIFDPSVIDRMSVYVLFQEGTFDVRLRSIEAVSEPRAFLPPAYNEIETSEDVIALIRSTISSGGGLYDKSYRELCIAMYWSVLNTLLSVDSSVVSDPIRAVICAGLKAVEDQTIAGSSKEELAWTLRYAMDAVIADLQGSARTTAQEWLPTAAEAFSMDATCLPRTSPAPGYFYDPTNEYILEEDELGNAPAVATDPPVDNAPVATDPPVGNAPDATNPPIENTPVTTNPPVDNELATTNPSTVDAPVTTNSPAGNSTFVFDEDLIEKSIFASVNSGGFASLSARRFGSIAVGILLLGVTQLL